MTRICIVTQAFAILLFSQLPVRAADLPDPATVKPPLMDAKER